MSAQIFPSKAGLRRSCRGKRLSHRGVERAVRGLERYRRASERNGRRREIEMKSGGEQAAEVKGPIGSPLGLMDVLVEQEARVAAEMRGGRAGMQK